MSTGFFSLLFSDGAFSKTAATISTRILRLNTLLGGLWLRDTMEEHKFVCTDLPLVSKLREVVQDSDAITSKSLAGLEVSQQPNRVSKGLFAPIQKVDTDKLLVGGK